MTKKRFSLSSRAFIFLVSLYFGIALNSAFWHFICSKAEFDSFKGLVFGLSLPFFTFIPLFLFFSLITLPKAGKPLIALLLVLSAAADYAMSNLGIIIDSDMVRNFAETNLREGMDFITLRSVLYVTFLGIIPAAAVFKTDIRFGSFGQELKQRFVYNISLLALLGIFAAACYKEYVSFGRNNSQVRKYVNTFNYIYAVGRYHQRQKWLNRKFTVLDAAPVINKTQTGRPRLLVLMIGETARAKNFSLYGYERETNPELKKQDIITFRDVTSCGTATAVSLPCMFSALPRRQFDVNEAQFTENLLDIAKKAGCNVFWNDNDDGCKGVCKRIENIDAKKGNRSPFCFGSYCHDEVLLDGLDERIKNIKQDSIIVLHMMGSHGPTYFKRYPDKFKRFLPACDTADLQNCTREQIVNSYDNTILYTDYVVSEVIDTLKRHPEIESAMLYISDHGESLGENNLYLHGFPYKIAPEEQKKVPMILWLSEKMRAAAAFDRRCLEQNGREKAYSHDNLFHSLLHLLGIKSSTYDAKLDLFGECMPETEKQTLQNPVAKNAG